MESGHGKGPCDGVGGGLKKQTDNYFVKASNIITSASQCVNTIQQYLFYLFFYSLYLSW